MYTNSINIYCGFVFNASGCNLLVYTKSQNSRDLSVKSAFLKSYYFADVPNSAWVGKVYTYYVHKYTKGSVGNISINRTM